MYPPGKVDVNMLNAIKSVLAGVSLIHSTFYRYVDADQN